MSEPVPVVYFCPFCRDRAELLRKLKLLAGRPVLLKKFLIAQLLNFEHWQLIEYWIRRNDAAKKRKPKSKGRRNG